MASKILYGRLRFFSCFPKKFESNSNLSINDIFTFSNKYNKYKLTSPKLAYKNINDTDLDRSYNYKYLKNLNFSFKGSQKPLIR